MATREALLRSAVRISVAAVVWGVVTGVLSVIAGASSGSLGLIGTGCDLIADVVASVVLIWRFHAELVGSTPPHHAERRAQLVASSGLLIVAVGLVVGAVLRLVAGDGATPSGFSVTLAALSLLGLPVFGRLKYRIAAALPSPALRTDGHTSFVGAATAAVTLLGLAATSALGWTAADPIAALFVAGLAFSAGTAGLREA